MHIFIIRNCLLDYPVIIFSYSALLCQEEKSDLLQREKERKSLVLQREKEKNSLVLQRGKEEKRIALKREKEKKRNFL